MDNTTSNTEIANTQNTSDETLLEQQFKEIFLEWNNDTQGNYFNCQEECNRRISQKNAFFQLLVKITYGHYHSQYIHNKQQTIRKQSLHHT